MTGVRADPPRENGGAVPTTASVSPAKLSLLADDAAPAASPSLPFGPRFVDEDGGGIPSQSSTTGESQLDESEPFEPRFLHPSDDAPKSQHVVWAPEVIAASRRRGWSNVLIAAAGFAITGATWLSLSILSFLIGLFGQSTWLGTIGICAIGSGVGLVGYAAAKEIRSFRSLKVVEQVRRVLGSRGTDLEAARDEALQWITRVEARLPEPNTFRRRLNGADTLAEIRGVMESVVSDHLHVQAVELGKRAAVEGATLVALCPHPAWDGAIALGRGLLIVREIAELYGVRPGVTVTITLLRRVARAAATTSAVSLVSQGLADHLLGSTPGLKHIFGAIPGTGTVAVRLLRLANVASYACSPLA